MNKKITFNAKGRAYDVEDPADLLVCFVQARREAAEETLEEVREKAKKGESEEWKAYKMERMAAKLVDFYRTKEKLVSLYAEAKRHNRELARLLEEENAELLPFYDGAKKALLKYGEPKTT